MESNENSNWITIRVQWGYPLERLTINSSVLPRKGEQIETTEFWENENDSATVTYFGKVLFSESRRNGGFRLSVKFSEHLNSHLAEKEAAYWGTATYTVSANGKTALVHWQSDDDRSPSGKVKAVVLRGDEERLFSREAYTRIKRSQSKLRELLLKENANCAITGTTTLEVLEAAHIVDVQNGGCDATENAILMRADLHLLFDKGLFSIQSDGAIRAEEGLSKEYKELLTDKFISPQTLARIFVFLEKRNRHTG